MSFDKKIRYMRFLQVVSIAFVLALVGMVSGCGSGAVSAPPVPVPDPAAGTPVTVSPGSADMFPDTPTTFTITGGKPGYTVFSSNTTALPVTQTVTGASFTVVANAVVADTTVDLTVRDAANTSTIAKANIKPSTLNNQITFTPFAPTATGCGTNSLCSGGDAQVVVKAVQNGVVLRNRPIKFDVFQGGFQLVTPGSNALVNTLTINTDELGEATTRLRAAAGVPTQVATLASTDTVSGLARRYNFNIVQQTNGAGILSTLPGATITMKGAKGTAGGDGFCPSGPGARVDYYIFGGTPPYSVASPLPLLASPVPTVVTTNGGGFTAQVNGCGKVGFIVTDATGRTVETAQIDSQQGDKGDAIPTASVTIAPSAVSIACGGAATISLVGSGSFTTTIASGGGAGFSVTPSAGPIPANVALRAGTGAVSTTTVVNFIVGGTITPVQVTLNPVPAGGVCP